MKINGIILIIIFIGALFSLAAIVPSSAAEIPVGTTGLNGYPAISDAISITQVDADANCDGVGDTPFVINELSEGGPGQWMETLRES
jgi:hypothetical protein